MEYNICIVAFMKLCDLEFNKSDIKMYMDMHYKYFLKLNRDDAKRIWFSILKLVEKNYIIISPFCITPTSLDKKLNNYKKCLNCFYIKNNGICRGNKRVGQTDYGFWISDGFGALSSGRWSEFPSKVVNIERWRKAKKINIARRKQ